jgi:hypothetical protein
VRPSQYGLYFRHAGCNGHAPPSKALVQGLARELSIDEKFLDKLADEILTDRDGRAK